MHNDWVIIKISGEDAKKFLQGQLTINLDELPSREARLSAHCNPKGRVISLFYIFEENQEYLLASPRSMETLTLNALKKYAVFFKCTLTVDETYYFYLQDTTPQFLTKKQLPSQQQLAQENWQIDFINLKVPVLSPTISEVFLPHELNLDEHHALSLNKGCYTGQEIIARMHYRNTIKTRLYQASYKGNLPQEGEDIFILEACRQSAAGKIVNAVSTSPKEHLVLLVAEVAKIKDKSFYLSSEPNTFFDININ